MQLSCTAAPSRRLAPKSRGGIVHVASVVIPPGKQRGDGLLGLAHELGEQLRALDRQEVEPRLARYRAPQQRLVEQPERKPVSTWFFFLFHN